jgi:hypothetical protein
MLHHSFPAYRFGTAQPWLEGIAVTKRAHKLPLLSTAFALFLLESSWDGG